MTDKPILLIDIDGVCNVIAGQRVKEDGGVPPHLRHARVRGYSVYFDRRHPEWIAELERRYEVAWSSLWERNAPDFAVHATFGDRWPWLNFSRHNRDRLNHEPFTGRTSGRVPAIKMGAIQEYIGSRPVAIVDDDFGGAERRWAEARTQAGVPTLVVVPDFEYGLQREHVDLLRAFAAKLRDGQSSVPR